MINKIKSYLIVFVLKSIYESILLDFPNCLDKINKLKIVLHFEYDVLNNCFDTSCYSHFGYGKQFKENYMNEAALKMGKKFKEVFLSKKSNFDDLKDLIINLNFKINNFVSYCTVEKLLSNNV